MRRYAYFALLWLADRCDLTAGWLSRVAVRLDAISETVKP